MTKDYTPLRASANTLLAKFGQAVTLTRRSSGEYDPATSSSTVSTSTQTGTGVVFDFAPGLRFAPGSQIEEGERQCFLSALKTDGSVLTRPKPGDTLTDAASVVWRVTGVSEVSPAGTDVLYELRVKGADA